MMIGQTTPPAVTFGDIASGASNSSLTYYYTVKSVDANGVESAPSNEAMVNIVFM